MKKIIYVILLAILIIAMFIRMNQTARHKELTKEIIIQEKAYVPNTVQIEESIIRNTRLTSFYANDECNTGITTASGLNIYDFDTNDKGWYTYQDKLVIATASNRLGETDMITYNLYDEVTLRIDGVEYESIVLDVCGACMRYDRMDLFVEGADSVIDTTIEVIE